MGVGDGNLMRGERSGDDIETIATDLGTESRIANDANTIIHGRFGKISDLAVF